MALRPICSKPWAKPMETTVLPSPEVVGVVAVTRMSSPRTGKAGLFEQTQFELGAVGPESFVLLGPQAEFLRNVTNGQKRICHRKCACHDRSRGRIYSA